MLRHARGCIDKLAAYDLNFATCLHRLTTCRKTEKETAVAALRRSPA
jgi:hypothetical protein